MNARRINSYVRYMHQGRTRQLDRYAEGVVEIATITRPWRAGTISNEVTIEVVFHQSHLTEDRVSSAGMTSRTNGKVHIREAHIPDVLGFVPREPGMLDVAVGWGVVIRGIRTDVTRAVYDDKELILWVRDRLE